MALKTLGREGILFFWCNLVPFSAAVAVSFRVSGYPFFNTVFTLSKFPGGWVSWPYFWWIHWFWIFLKRIIPQIAIAIGVLTSKKGGGRRTTLADWTRHQAGAIVGCHCSVLWLGGRVTTNFRGVDVVPLLGAIVGCLVVCYGWGGGRRPTGVDVVPLVPLLGAIVVCYGWGGRWRPPLREWTWCHCWVPLQAAIVVCWRGGWRPTLGEWTFHCRVPMAPYTAMASRKASRKAA